MKDLSNIKISDLTASQRQACVTAMKALAILLETEIPPEMGLIVDFEKLFDSIRKALA